MQNLNDIWRDVHKRLGFYTPQNSKSVPDSAGIYAWFLPLWFFRDDLDEYVNLIHGFYCYDPLSKEGNESPRRVVQLDFNWDKYEITLQKNNQVSATDSMREKWEDMNSDAHLKDIFSQSLMEASLFMPPLYVGKADSISERYSQHVNGKNNDANDFHNRFTKYAQQVNLPLAVSDLLFVCIKTESTISAELRKNELNKLLEQIVMRISKPPFSIR